MRILRSRLAAGWCHGHHGDRRRPAGAQHPETPTGPQQGRVSSTKVSPAPASVWTLKTKTQNSPSVSFVFATESKFQSAKRALHTAVPDRLLSREAERDAIRSFLEEKVLQRRPGSLYISGAPGTGKTACFNCVLQEMEVGSSRTLPRGAAPPPPPAQANLASPPAVPDGCSNTHRITNQSLQISEMVLIRSKMRENWLS